MVIFPNNEMISQQFLVSVYCILSLYSLKKIFFPSSVLLEIIQSKREITYIPRFTHTQL